MAGPKSKSHRVRAPSVLFVRDSIQRAYLPGVWRYVQTTDDWTILASFLSDLQPDVTAGAMHWASAAVIDVFTEEMSRFSRSLKIPLVNLVDGELGAGLPTVSVDNRAVGRMAFEHFRTLGLTRFYYLPWRAGPDNALRQEGFLEAAQKAGMGTRAQVVESVLSTSDWKKDVERQAHIFNNLPKPGGMLCFADWNAAIALQAARVAGISVPDELAIMGVDDDEIICESARPTLTSIDIAHDRIGFEAARIAIGMARGESPPRQPILIPPIGVIERLSTQILATDDEDVAAALRYIQKQDAVGVRVTADDVADAVCISRRGLDGKFVKVIGHTVANEISRQQLQRTLHLLERTNLGLVEIASRCGFMTISHLSRVVHQHTGRSPIAYRKWVRP